MTQVIPVPSLATIPTGIASYVPQESLGDSLQQLFAQNQIAVIPIAGGTDTAGALAAWLCAQKTQVVVSKVTLLVTTPATGACTVSIGTAANATTSSANLIDTLDVHTAAGLFSTSKNPGTNGKADQLCTATQYVTASTASGASAGLVAMLYIHYMTL